MLIIRILVLLFFSVTVQSEVPYIFSNGSPANASQVNANFAALAKRIDLLELQIADLRSTNVAGHTYKIEISTTAVSRFDSDSQNSASVPGFWNVDLYVDNFTLSFNDNTQQTATLKVDLDAGGDLWQDGSLRFSDDGDTEEDISDLVFYWSQTGRTVSLSESIGGESVLTMSVTDGASALHNIGAEKKRNHDTGSNSCGNGFQRCYGDEFESSVLIGTRISMREY